MNRIMSIIVAITMSLLAAIAPAQTPPSAPSTTKLGDIYETTITGLDDTGGMSVQRKDVLVRLTAKLPTVPGGLPELTITAPVGDRILAYLVDADTLPEEFRELFPKDHPQLFIVRPYSGIGPQGQVELPIYLGDQAKNTYVTMTLLDANGDPFPGCTLELELNPTHSATFGGMDRQLTGVASAVSGTDGKVSYPLPIVSGPRLPDGPPARNLDKNVQRMADPYRLSITEPTLGQKVISQDSVHIPWRIRDDTPDTWQLPFLPEGVTPAEDSPVFLGHVIDSEGQPLKNAALYSHTFLSKDGATFRFNGQATLLTGKDGRFQFTPPRAALIEQSQSTGKAQPPTCLVSVRKPPEAAYIVATIPTVTLQSGEDTTLTFQRATNLVCEILGEEGKPLPNEENGMSGMRAGLELLHVPPEMSGSAPRGYSGNQISKEGDDALRIEFQGVPLPGTYRLRYQKRLYKPQDLDWADAEKTITWEPYEGTTVFTGRVVDALTGEPVSGACVAMSDHGTRIQASIQQFDDMLREIFKDAPAGGSIVPREGAPTKIGDSGTWFWYQVYAIGRTDADGHYRLESAPGVAGQAIDVYMPGYLHANSGGNEFPGPQGDLKEPESRQFPDLALQPAAIATVTLLAPDDIAQKIKEDMDLPTKGGRIPACWFVARFTPSVDDADGVWSMEATSSLPLPGEKGDVLIPAGVPFTLEGRIRNRQATTTPCPALWQVDDPVKPGDTIVLPPKAVESCTMLVVRLRDENGNPQSGYTVLANGDPLKLATTMKTGVAVLYLDDPHVSTLEVKSPDGKLVIERNDFTITEGGEPLVLELTLPKTD